jgi:hypothetical protein
MTTTEQATTTTSPLFRRRRLLRRSAYAVVTTLAAALALLVGAAPAHAAPLDSVFINTAKVDFALMFDPMTCEPVGAGGILDWQAGGGTFTPRLTGIHSSHAASADHSYLTLEAFSANGALLGLSATPVLFSPAACDQAAVNISLAPIPKAALHHVTVTAYLWQNNSWMVQSVITAKA